ncbi:undecaprenyl-diphosphate phosphatase [uncultured Sulfitobacter sp.]|uniref:undecaprenyl-diphosphate phosphatase n=1 Tax=uncultured Sulfitobacter sp. TaxID=191468 RepID=UPI00259A8E7F|nr:undecaprenyl-diphosphate phosphatase [uncultured Sulfitobacter sp.]
MTLFQLLLVAIIQGLTEFLPVSSSGHLILLPTLTGGPDQGLAIDVAVHVGTLLAVVLYFRSEVAEATIGLGRLLRGKMDTPGARLAALLILATLPVLVVGLAFKLLGIDEMLRSVAVIGWTMLLFGIVLYWADHTGRSDRDTGDWDVKGAVWMGLAQGLAVLPGLSRSGLTIATGMAAGMRPVAAARLSFLMSMPAILGATALELLQEREGALAGVAPAEFLLGMAAAALTGFLALRWLLALVEQQRFHWFAPYCGLVGLIILSLSL